MPKYMGESDILTDPARSRYDEYVSNDPDQLLTATEVAKIFRVDEKTIRRWTIAGDFDYCVIRTPGKQYRYRADRIRERIQTSGPGPFKPPPAGPGPANQPPGR